MITGSLSIPKVVEESVCRTTKDYELSEVGDYEIYAHVLMPNIEFGESKKDKESINSSIFINDGTTKLQLASTVECQNYLTTYYVGRAPLEFYGPKTKKGREFLLICKNGETDYEFRVFGTESAIRGWNRNANENFIYKK